MTSHYSDTCFVLTTYSQKKEEEKENYNTSKYAQAIGHLLKCFSEWIQSYKDFVSAEQKRNKFEDSFYVGSGTKDLHIFLWMQTDTYPGAAR